MFFRSTWTTLKKNMLSGELTFGGHPYGNQLVRKGLGGSGGGSVKVIAQNVDIDGRINVDGATPHPSRGEGAGKLRYCCWHRAGNADLFLMIETRKHFNNYNNNKIVMGQIKTCAGFRFKPPSFLLLLLLLLLVMLAVNLDSQ